MREARQRCDNPIAASVLKGGGGWVQLAASMGVERGWRGEGGEDVQGEEFGLWEK